SASPPFLSRRQIRGIQMNTSMARNCLKTASVLSALLVLAAPAAAQSGLEAGKAARAQGMAQQGRELQRDEARKDGFTDDALYSNATRKAPGLRASGRTANQLEKMMKLYDGEQGAEARVVADEVIAADGSNAFEKAYSAQIAAQVAYDAGDTATAVKYYQQAIELNGPDNNAHYNVMLNLAQLPQAGGDPEASL